MKIDYIVIHHSAISIMDFFEQFDVINRGHKNKNWGNPTKPIYAKKSDLGSYVQYHYLIEPDGEVKAGRTEKEVGWHAGVWKINNSSVAICLSGNFDKDLPTGQQEESLRKLLVILKRNYPNAEIKYHRDFKNTHCPGNKIKDNWAKNLISNNKNMFVKKAGDYKVYALFGDSALIHFNTDGKTFLDTFDNAIVIEVSEKEFKKFRVITNVSIKK